MQKQFSDNWNKMYQCLSEPMANIAELNMNTLKNWSKNTGLLQELTQTKKTEDFLWTQMKLVNMGQLEAITYTKKVGDIWADAINQINEIYADVLSETTVKTSEVMNKTSEVMNKTSEVMNRTSEVMKSANKIKVK